MGTIRSRESDNWYSTDAIEYTFHHFENLSSIVNNDTVQCGFLSVYIGYADSLSIPCIASQREEKSYYQTQEQLFTENLRDYYRKISTGCARKVTETFIDYLRLANATHIFPECNPDSVVKNRHYLYIKTYPEIHYYHVEFDELTIGMDEDDLMPATTNSVLELIKASRMIENYDKVEHDQCAICMEDMEPKNSLSMPCSHEFHCACLLRWLDSNHVCPLCRYPLPAAKVIKKKDWCGFSYSDSDSCEDSDMDIS